MNINEQSTYTININSENFNINHNHHHQNHLDNDSSCSSSSCSSSSIYPPPSKRLKCTYDSIDNTDDVKPLLASKITSNNSNNNNNNNILNIMTRKQFACLRNLGSTCYINCIIQVIRYSPGFSLSIHRLAKQIDYLKSLNIELEKEISNNSDSIFVKHLHELLIEMSDKEKLDRRPVYSPRKFVNTVWSSLNFWSDGSQQDAHEFLQYTIHFINECDLYLKKLHQQYQLKQLEIMDANVKLKQEQENHHYHHHEQLQQQQITMVSDKLLVSPTQGRRMSTRRQQQQQQLQLQKQEQTNHNNSSSSLYKCKSSTTLKNSEDNLNNNTTTSIKVEATLKLSKSANYLRTPTKGGASASTANTPVSTTNSNTITPPPTAATTPPLQSTTTTSTTQLINIDNKKLFYLNESTNINNNSSNNNDIIIIDDEDKGLKNEPIQPSPSKIKNDDDDDDQQLIFKPLIKDNQQQLTTNRFKFNIIEQIIQSHNNNNNKLKQTKQQQQQNDDNVKQITNNNNNNNNNSNSVNIDNKIKTTATTLPPPLPPPTTTTITKDSLISRSHINPILLKLAPNLINRDRNIKIRSAPSPPSSPVQAPPPPPLPSPTIVFSNKTYETRSKTNSPITTTTTAATNNNSANNIITNNEETDLINKNFRQTNIKLKKCYVLLERIDETKFKNGVYYLNDANRLSTTTTTTTTTIPTCTNTTIIITSKSTTPLFSNTINNDNNNNNNNSVHKPQTKKSSNYKPVSTTRKLKIKSKTFPEVVNFNNQPIDAIISLDSTSSIYNSNSTTATTTTTTATLTSSKRVKQRTTSANETYNNLVTQIPSPAELLRKYSSIKGHVCEMDKIFKGSSVTLTQCLACENLRKCPEAFYDRSLPVNTITNESMDLDWVLKCLSNESYLDEDSKYMCDICASKQEAKIYTQYTEMPNILVLHLLSYGITSSIDGNLNTQKMNSRSKLVTCFDCVCSECNMQQNTNSNRNLNDNSNTIRHVFKLYAVVMHSGVSLNSGHYTAFINYQTINENTIDINDHLKTSQNNKMNMFNTVNNNCSCTENSISPNSNLNTFTHTCQVTSNELASDSYNTPEWLHFDDTKVKLLSNNEFHRKIIDSNYDSPYILFYVKNTLDLSK